MVSENGVYDYYPHSDFEGPCTCAECQPDPKHGYYPTCGICGCQLRRYGLCKMCMTKPEATKYIVEHC